ncbi:putative aquaporin SIP2-1 [Castilleja foliolosa]|uniref:Aquaporin SIP2-1 n=1 Tax=Castilleja foliolosa TaxID=1961234 RepID=A0ABD3CRK9_9LAMI
MSVIFLVSLLKVVGSVYGVRHILNTLPEIGRGPRLNVDITKGALTEGFLTFAIVILSLGLSRKISNSFYMKTWISSVSKLALHILGSDLTGGCMNPASVMGWAFANGEHITKEHLIVYWLAPVEATLAAVWVFGLLVRPKKDETSTAKKNEAPPLKSQKSD